MDQVVRCVFLFILLIGFSVAFLLEQNENSPDCPADCNSPIYCYGELLKAVQLAKIHEHAMNFVDKKLLDTEENILNKFQKLKEENKLDPDSLQVFVNENFAEDDPYSCILRDIEIGLQPKLLDRVADPVYKQFVIDVQKIWPELAVHVDEDAKDHPERHSAIYLPNCFIKAGGFFKSQFYWDGYWTISGLLVTGMTETVKDMLLNYFHLIDLIGFIPNANRNYYTQRSQPPFFIPMIKKYLDARPDEVQFLAENLPRIEKEFLWWMENRAVNFTKDGKQYTMYQYHQKSCNPRPEGYVEDYYKGQKFVVYEQRNYFYTQCHTVAESGLDFSTRARRQNFYEKGYGTRRNLDMTGLVPVELNAILAMNARLLSEWFANFGDLVKAETYRQISITLIQYIDEVFRIDYLGAWFDYDIVEKRHRTRFYPTNLSPLYTLAYDTSKAYEIGKSAVEYLKKISIINSDGTPKFIGVPTSLINSPEQWDFRNGWAPMQSFVIEGLYKTGQEEAVMVAQELAKIWVKTNWVGLQNEHEMFEKYDAVEMGKIGGRGTYKPQTGFGWTNGFLMVLFDLFGEILQHTDYDNFEADTRGVDFNEDVRK